MIVRRFKIKSHGNEYNVYSENFTSSNEVVVVSRSKPDVDGWRKRRDYCAETWTGQDLDGSWTGFYSQEEFDHLMKLGVDDTSMVKDVARYTAKAEVQDKEKLTKRVLDVVGGGVDVPVFLTGNPQCMYNMRRQKVKSRIVNIGLECGLTCDYSVEQYKRAGMCLTKVIAKLEKAGYRVSLTTMAAFYDYNGNISVMTNTVKRENMPMNYARIMFPLTSIAYFRGLGFGWVVRTPEYTGGSSLGPHISRPFGDEAVEKVDEMFKRSLGNANFTGFMMKTLVNLYESRGAEGLEKYIESKIMETVR